MPLFLVLFKFFNLNKVTIQLQINAMPKMILPLALLPAMDTELLLMVTANVIMVILMMDQIMHVRLAIIVGKIVFSIIFIILF